ncbi:MAG: PorT family protein [Tannerella sp.]|jgi:hypothetical protein|nr:PorT family protein [Tannerella sp.]
MRKLLFTVAMCGLISLFNGLKAQKRFGLSGGYDRTSLLGSSKANFINGFHIGATYDLKNFGEKWYMQTGLLFTNGGWSYDDHKVSVLGIVETNIKDFTVKMYFIEMPFNMSFRLPVGEHKLLLNIGPYIRYGISGKAKYNNDESSQEYNAFDENANNRFEIGSNIGLGFAIKNKYLINAAYQIAGTQAEKAIVNTYSMRYRLGIGYLF